MVAPFVSTLNKAARSALPIIQGGVRAGLTSSQINTAIKTAFGRSIRRQTLLDIIRAEKGIQRTGPVLRSLGLNKMPNPARLPEAITRIRRNFAFVVEVLGEREDTGVRVTQMITIATDNILTRGRIQQLAKEVVELSKERYPIRVIAAKLISGTKKGVLGTLTNPLGR